MNHRFGEEHQGQSIVLEMEKVYPRGARKGALIKLRCSLHCTRGVVIYWVKGSVCVWF